MTVIPPDRAVCHVQALAARRDRRILKASGDRYAATDASYHAHCFDTVRHREPLVPRHHARDAPQDDRHVLLVALRLSLASLPARGIAAPQA